tara:strand:+ start:655 stop:2523 length:1869 start_codon:yes stop_codon:yes gene_type:complete
MYLDLFKRYVHKLKQSSGGQYIGLCPYHEDTEASLSINMDRGVYYCHACGANGNAYMMAKELGHENPTQFIDESVQSVHYKNAQNAQYSYKKENIQNIQYEPQKDYTRDIEKYVHNLKDNMDKYPSIWDKALIDDLGLGYCTKNQTLVYAYEDSGYKIHNTTSSKGLTKRWYLGHKINEYSTNEPLYICEGEKDTITLLTWNKQAVSVSGGCKSMPSDEMLELIKDFEIIICYDNDDAGRSGADNLGQILLNENVSTIQWAKDLPNKFDVTDAFEKDDGASEFFDAVKNKRTIRRSRIMTGINMLVRDVPEQNWIIDKVLPQDCQIVFGGTEGSNKSFFAMQMGMSIANNEKQFLEFDINVKNQRVLFFDAESGADRLTRRYQVIAGKLDNFGKNGASRFYCSTTLGYDGDIFDFIEQDVKRVKPNILIVDCLYHILGGKDGSKNHVMLPILQRLTDIRKKYNLTFMLISHFNKGGHEAGLHIDRIQGAGALKNWLEHCMLITYTNVEDTRLFKFDKSRDGQQPKCYYKLDWNYPLLSNGGVIMNHQPLLVSNEKKLKWDTALDRLGNEFKRVDFTRIVAHEMGYSERTASNWLNHMINSGVIQKVRHNEYIKALDVVSESE